MALIINVLRNTNLSLYKGKTMGTWGMDIFEDDLACDIRDEYVDMLDGGYSCKKATKMLIKEYKDDSELSSENCGFFWLPLAKIQIEKGEIDKRVKRNALEIIDKNTDLDNLVQLGASEESIKERAAVLQDFRESLVAFANDKKFRFFR